MRKQITILFLSLCLCWLGMAGNALGKTTIVIPKVSPPKTAVKPPSKVKSPQSSYVEKSQDSTSALAVPDATIRLLLKAEEGIRNDLMSKLQLFKDNLRCKTIEYDCGLQYSWVADIRTYTEPENPQGGTDRLFDGGDFDQVGDDWTTRVCHGGQVVPGIEETHNSRTLDSCVPLSEISRLARKDCILREAGNNIQALEADLTPRIRAGVEREGYSVSSVTVTACVDTAEIHAKCASYCE